MTRDFLLFLSVVAFLLNYGRGCEDDQITARRDFTSFTNDMYDPWMYPYYYNYQPSSPLTGFYEGRTVTNRLKPIINPLSDYFRGNEEEKADGRLGFTSLGSTLLNTGIFNNRFTSANAFRPFSTFTNRLPITINPNFASSLPTFESCSSSSGDSGICASTTICSLFGGRPSGSCALGSICCVNAITTCGASTTLNNTYWQSPATALSSPSTCALTVKLDSGFNEQKKAICQVRLDFISFSIAQPDLLSLCSTDTFQVGRSSKKVPTICGDNNGQHMYLEVPSSATTQTDLQLLFNFGSTTINRSWKIKIALLPCGASYLAPEDCLQYFSSSSGRVTSFNWKDMNAVDTATRQLANQDYSICFRPELVDRQLANKMCVTACASSSTPPASFKVSGIFSLDVSRGQGTCKNDFVLIPGATNPADDTDFADRYCGAALNPTAAGASITICTTVKPFRIYYRTNDNEGSAANRPIDTGNLGFCLDFAEKTE